MGKDIVVFFKGDLKPIAADLPQPFAGWGTAGQKIFSAFDNFIDGIRPGRVLE